jgi:hypothetical protein
MDQPAYAMVLVLAAHAGCGILRRTRAVDGGTSANKHSCAALVDDSTAFQSPATDKCEVGMAAILPGECPLLWEALAVLVLNC